MPISGGKYVAPTWVNSTSPPIDADELQDICDSIEAYADPASTVPTIPNPNLLDNWYFVGGGSQQGGGQFPINTRGQTSYTGGNIYGIDRWKSTGSNPVIAVESGYLGFTPSGTFNTVRQYIEDFKSLSGKTVTISAIVEADAAFDFLVILQYHDASDAERNPILFSERVSNKRLITATGTMPDLSSAKDCYLRLGNGSTVQNIPLKIYAAKVELGDTQTLAHQENGVWVLNEIPNYDIQFARCSELPSVPARYETGTYVGTGTVGSSNPNTLTFGFKPKYVMVTGTSTSGTLSAQFVSGMTTVVTRSSTAYTYYATWGDNSISWYRNTTNTGQAWTQMNSSGVTYYYIAIG